MLTSLAIIFIVGLLLGYLFKQFKLPSLMGMLLGGIIIGPYVFNLLDDTIITISPDLRELALVIILLRAGLSLNIADVKKVGRPAFFMAFIPATFEILSYIIFAPLLFGISAIEAAVMGSVLAAVSPAVVVPRMISLVENNHGTEKGIPQLIIASTSCDDIFVIVLFSSFVAMASGGDFSAISLLEVPVSIILGGIVGVVVGIVGAKFFTIYSIRNSVKVILILSISFLLLFVDDTTIVSGLIAIMTMAVIFKANLKQNTSVSLSAKIGKLWLGAEILLFVLVGASVNINYMMGAWWQAIIIIAVSLCFRGVGVFVSLLGTHFTPKEKLFCVFSYLPKATVQAAIGAVPLAIGLPCGDIVLSVAVMGIILTAPMGAILIDNTKNKLI
ncbi:MAG: potassium transporter [Epulopiscium sp. Nele67-Bin004]|nr:MAG: potassium transporter [Epulopiscium sp. Nele67-Bin004]